MEKMYDKQSFFRDVRGYCNYIPTDVVSDVYYGILKVILNKLKDNGSITLPNFGRILVERRKARRIFNVNTKVYDVAGSSNIIKIAPCNELRAYINKQLF